MNPHKPSSLPSDLFATDQNLIYAPGRYIPLPNKSETYPVEGDNAELRHYLAPPARRSRCFSRCIEVLRHAIELLVYAWNRRQLHRHHFPDYPSFVFQFLVP